MELSPQRKKKPVNPRRTSLSLAHRLPNVRQNKLEEAVEESVGAVFFTLHVEGEAEPAYISEVKDKSAHFNFQFFDLDDSGPTISRSCMVIVRLWAKRPKSETWIYLLEELVDLRMLNFIGTLLDRRFPPNALIFHLEDGVYSLDFPNRIGEPKQSPSLLTSSYNALMKLANLESSIEDALSTRNKIVSQINHIIESSEIVPTEVAEEELTLARKYVVAQERTNTATEKHRDQLKSRLETRRAAMKEARLLQTKAEEDIANNRDQLQNSETAVTSAERDIHGQRRRICSELNDMFPITPIPNAPALSFEICNIPIPNSVYDASTARAINEDVLSAGLGLVTLLVYNLQFYLSHPLPYPLTPYGSRSYATDSISLLKTTHARRTSSTQGSSTNPGHSQDFPLYLPKGGSISGHWRFEYGWFLLNKNIEALCSSQGLKVVDIRHTLPNLKYLLYVCSAGTEDVPERKKGGVRGLWAGRIKGRMGSLPMNQALGFDGSSDTGSLSGSRRGSVDSDVPTSQEGLLRRKISGPGDDNNDDEQLNDGINGVVLPFGDDARISLRTKGLRENRG